MRLILVNPHSHNFGKMVSGEVLRRKSFLKYDYFTDFYLKQNRPVGFFIDGTRNSFGIAWPVFPKFFVYLELLAWMFINTINPFKVKVYFNPKKLNPQTDVLFDFSRSLVDISDADIEKAPWSQFEGLTLIHFTHYFKDIKKLSERFARVPHGVVIAENDLTTSDYFRKFFPQVKQVYHLPFTFTDRFVSTGPYEKRLNKCVALGSITRVVNNAFVDFFGSPDELHPMRNILFREALPYKKKLDSFIQGFNVTVNVRKISANDSVWAKLAKKCLPFFLLEKFYPTPQITYFRFNIVEKYNRYKMFICPEEIVGLPSINFVEGMACQCAYLGEDNAMYTDLGLIPDTHYITYKKNDLEDFLAKVSFYQNNPKKLARIAQQGYDYVRKHFNRQTVASVFWNDLEMMSRHFSEKKKVLVHSSFTKK